MYTQHINSSCYTIPSPVQESIGRRGEGAREENKKRGNYAHCCVDIVHVALSGVDGPKRGFRKSRVWLDKNDGKNCEKNISGRFLMRCKQNKTKQTKNNGDLENADYTIFTRTNERAIYSSHHLCIQAHT